MNMLKQVLGSVALLLVVAAAGAAEPVNAPPAADDVLTVRELVSRLTAHGVTPEGIARHFGKPVAELGEDDIPRLQQGLDRLRAKKEQGVPADISDFAQEQRQVKANIELWQDRVQKKLQQVDRIVSGLDLRQIESQKMAVDSLLEVLNQLDEEARSIVSAHQQVKPDLKLYREALLKAPAVFRKIADGLDKKASERQAGLIKTGYADFASEARKLAANYESQAAGVGGLEAELAQKMALVYESQQFIADVRELLKAIPTSHGIETQKFVERLNVYISVLRQAIDAMKGAADRISEPQSPTTDPGRGVPLTRTDDGARPAWRKRPAG